jgi:branched-chain amino acid transport system ATP-binding protein
MSILSVKNVNKQFGGLKALHEVNLEIEAGTVHAIIGPNGAGKSTLLNCFVGRLDPDTGSVDFDGVSLLGMRPHEINQVGVSRVFQTPEIFGDLTLAENVMIPAFASRDGAFRINGWSQVADEASIHENAMELLEDVGLAANADTIANQLSRGDKRRLELAMCLVQRPKLLLLDEPTAGMARADTNNTIEWRVRIPTIPSICSRKSPSAVLPWSSSSMTCTSCFRWQKRFQYWRRERLSSKACPTKSRVTRKFRKPTWEEHTCER